MYCPKMSFRLQRVERQEGQAGRQAAIGMGMGCVKDERNSGRSSRHHWLDRSIKWTMQLEAGRGTYVRSALLLLCQGKGTNICRCRAMHQGDKPCRMVVLLTQRMSSINNVMVVILPCVMQGHHTKLIRQPNNFPTQLDYSYASNQTTSRCITRARFTNTSQATVVRATKHALSYQLHVASCRVARCLMKTSDLHDAHRSHQKQGKYLRVLLVASFGMQFYCVSDHHPHQHKSS